MSDKDIEDVLREWAQEEPPGKPDRSRVVGSVVGRLSSTHRRGRWWPIASLRREARATEPRTTTTPQHRSIPATNGPTPTFIGRTRSMLSPVSAITAGAMAFALGGALLIAQPLDQPSGSAPGADAGVSAEPTWVTATVFFASGCDFGETATEGDVTQERGMNCRGQRWQSDDPRLDGRANVAHNADSFETDGQGYSLVTSAIEFYNDVGGWQCTNGDRVVPVANRLGQTSRLENDRLHCVGYGDNAGLSAVLVADWSGNNKTLEGLIFPGEMPPLPEFPSPQQG